MDQSWTQLFSLRCMNAHRRWFVPQRPLRQLMTKDFIRDILRVSGTKTHHLDETTDIIFKNRIMIFSILILIRQPSTIATFIERDELQDRKLPFELRILEKEFPPACAQEFYEKQWEFTAPGFFRGTLIRALNENVVLPFIKDEMIGEGSFGKVYEIKLHPDNQKLEVKFRQRLARKELLKTDDHKAELESLSILNHLNHPNILELLTSYTHDEKHNLVFPLAEGGTLDELLKIKSESTSFNSDETLLVALAGLSSGIEHVHNFVESKIDLSLIGCHHDLRPKNILISKDTFILADFGLSRFKNSSEDSNTVFKMGKGDYLAPECEDLGKAFEKLNIRRSSDIWSFGCIIAELATYMRLGPHAVREFREKRKFKVLGFPLFYFHCGQNQRNQSVDMWLEELENASSKPFQMLLELVREMLCLKENERPKADTVTARLRIIAIHEVVESVDKLFTEVLPKSDSFDALLENQRFEGWKYAIGLLDHGRNSESSNSFHKGPISGFQATLEYLFGIRNHLKSILLQNTYAQNLVYLPVCYLNDHLYDLLDLERREKATSYLKTTVMESHVDLPSTTKEFRSLSLDREIRMRITLTEMTRLTIEHSQTDTNQQLLEMTAIKNLRKFGDHDLGLINIAGVTRQVLVEWRKHAKDYTNNEVSKELFNRVNAIAKLLSLEKPKDFRNLHCCGFFHDPNHFAFGLVFHLPSYTVEPLTLRRLISITQRNMPDQPLLEDRFLLAFTLAKAVLEFHMVGWLHKRLTSFNVAFFPTENLSLSKYVMEPYIIGFSHSRPDDPLAFTEGFQDTDRHYYQHPDYLRHGNRYRPEFDYYSLGIVLLEIGLWCPLKAMIPDSKTSFYKVHRGLLNHRVPSLGQCLGVAYRDAVRACLEGDFGKSDIKDEEGQVNAQSVYLHFESLVVSPLKKCWVKLAECQQ